MGLGIYNKTTKLINFYERVVYKYILIKNEKRKMKDTRRVKEYESVQLTEEQDKEIQNFFLQNYGKKIDTKWHRMYQSFTGNYDKKYMPEIIFTSELESVLSDRNISRVFADKSMVEILYSGIDGLYIPKTSVVCSSGIYYDSNRNVITKEKAIELLNNCGKKVIKKTIDSSSGRGVLIVNIKDGIDIKNNKPVKDLLKEFGNNFIVQELITNSDDIKRIYDKSLNTFRVMTYVIDGKMYHIPLVMRIGRQGKEVDNIHAGGLFIGINDDGTLKKNAFTEFKDTFLEHPDTKLKFEGYKIDKVKEMIDIAYKCHGRTPHLRLISWDFTINDKNYVTLIEVNLNGQSIWFPQMANGVSAFGDNTEEILKLLNRNKKERHDK